MPATPVSLDFEAFVRAQKHARDTSARQGAAYAYPGDLKVLSTLDKAKPVKLALEATVRMWKSVSRAELLGTAVKVSPAQFPHIHALGQKCAETLHILPPTIYITAQLGSLNAHTFGTNEDSYIVLNSALVDHLSTEELLSVIGHECGHIQNGHVVFSTALYYLVNFASQFVRWIVKPAVLALQAWSRRAEITCDRAGLICSRDPAVMERSFIKLALGSKALYEQFNVEAFLAQLAEAKATSPSRFTEFGQSHPYLPKRIAALRLFAQTTYYRGLTGETGGSDMAECNARTAELLAQ